MRVNTYICNKKFTNDAEKITFEDIIEELEQCRSDVELWVVGNIELANTQVDILIIKENCLLIIDMKNYTGEIVGNENGDWKVRNGSNEIIMKDKKENCFKQAKTQRFALSDELVLLVKNGHLVKFKDNPSVFVNIKAWMYFNEGSTFDEIKIGQKALNWFKVITKETLCEDVLDADSSRFYTFSKEEINKLINLFNAERIYVGSNKYREQIDEIWSQIEQEPENFEIAKNANKTFKDILSKTKNEELRSICHHGIALTSETHEESIKRLLDLYEAQKEYRGYGKHVLLSDIFKEYFSWNDKRFKDKVKEILLTLKEKQQIDKIREIFVGLREISSVIDLESESWGEPPEDDLYCEIGEFLIKNDPDDIDILYLMSIWYFENNKPEEFISTVKKLSSSNISAERYQIYQIYIKNILDLIVGVESSFVPEKDFCELIDRLKEINALPSWKLDIYLGDFYLMWLSYLRDKISDDEEKRFKDKRVRIYSDLFDNYIDDKEYLHAIIERYHEWHELVLDKSVKVKDYAINLLEKYKLGVDDFLLLIDVFKTIGDKTDDYTYLYKSIEKALEEYPADAEINLKSGKMYEELKQKKEAIECFERVLKSSIYKSHGVLTIEDLSSYYNPNHRYNPRLKKAEDRGHVVFELDGRVAFDSLLNLYFEKDEYKKVYDLCEWLESQDVSDSEKYTAQAYIRIGEWLIEQYNKYNKEEIREWLIKQYDKYKELGKEIKEEKKKNSLKDFALPSKLKEVIDFIIYELQEKKTPDSILLYGPPGCGKTELAQCIAGELGWEIKELDSGILSKWTGESENNLSQFFKNAINEMPCVIFIDEFEDFGLDRKYHQHSWEYSLSSEMLRQIEKILKMKDAQILIIAACNDKTVLDRAMIRRGRFNHHYPIPFPDLKTRKKIFEIKLNALKDEGKNIDERLSYGEFASQTESLTGADIHYIIFEIIPQILFKYKKENKEDLLIDDKVVLQAINKFKKEKWEDTEKKSKELPYYL